MFKLISKNILFSLFINKPKKNMMDFTELFKRIIKYLVEGIMVAIAAYAIPKRSLNIEEICLLAVTAAATFSILDTYVPSIGVTTRSGAGFGIGANLVGFPGGL
jgi:ABC-type Co2+ transport system permease subunit